VFTIRETETMANEAGALTGNADTPRTTSTSRFDRTFFLVLALWMLISGVVGFWLGTNRTTFPGDNSAEVGFARDMIVHHANAVDMATILRDRTDDDAMRLFALDVMLTQQGQIGQMQGWLQVWELPIAPSLPQMAWMGMPVEGQMPGMATAEQLAQLDELEGVEADVLFLNLMIPHHQAGVDMARAVLQRTERPEVRALAQAIVTAQETEIAIMREMLQGKGAEETPPADTTDGMNHGD
jgi:uncharacterized protein (DUF305 family)